MSTKLLSGIAVPDCVSVYMSEHEPVFAPWLAAREKAGVIGWAKIGDYTYRCRRVPERNGRSSHWEFIDIPVEVVVVLFQQKFIEPGCEVEKTLPVLVTPEGGFNIPIRAVFVGDHASEVYSLPCTN